MPSTKLSVKSIYNFKNSLSKLNLIFSLLLIILVVQFGKSQSDNLEGVNTPKKIDKIECVPITIDTGACDVSFTRENFFGLDSSTFTQNKKVYVLDFEAEGRHPTLYKIARKKMRKRITNSEDKWINKPKGGALVENEHLFLIPYDGGSESLNSKDNVEILVNKVNKFRYKVSVKDSIINLISDPPFLLREIFLGDSSGILGSAVDAIKNNFSTKEKNGSSNLEILVDAIECFEDDYNRLVDRVICSLNRCQDLPCCLDCNEVYSRMVKKLTEVYRRIDKEVLEENSINEKLNKEKGIYKHCSSLEKLKNENTENEKTLQKLKTPQGDAKAKEEIAKIKKEIDNLEKKIKDNKTKIAALNKLEIKCPKNIQVMKEDINKLKEKLNIIESLKSVKNRLPNTETITELVVYVNSMTRHSQQYFHLIPQLKGEELKIDIRIKANDTITKLDPSAASDVYHYKLQIPIINRWYASFSSGSFVGFGKNLQPKIYDWREIPGPGGIVGDGENFELIESGFEPIPVGFAALINIQKEIRNGLGLGISIGAGLPIRKPIRPSYLGGLSVSFGRERQVVVTGGAMLTAVDVLNRSLSTGVIYNGIDGRDIKYNQEFKPGPFIAVTYTPFKRNSSGN